MMPSVPRILCYHKVDRRLELGVTRISPRRFARQIERLAADGWRTLTLDEVASCARGDRAVAPNEIAITFDDAYRGLREHAFPVLEAHGFAATCFVITAYAGRLNRWDVAYGGRRFPHLTWRDMRRWQSRGITFASHTVTHPRLTWISDARAAEELHGSRRDLRRALDAEPRGVSYPFGACASREYALAREAGYDVGFTLASSWTGDPMAIPRLPVYVWSPPRPGTGPLRHVERAVATVANRASVGTALIQRGAGRGFGRNPVRQTPG
ncbi:MAG TPA: polysaccharide deacetylase family protein [Gemmatimonadaceae bacterium]|nr:polysaccharide deacetylase family protein [Gemmatimonadaceae bacterium]